MSLRSRLGIRLRHFRKQRGLTQEALAERVERSVDAISGFERGVVLPSIEALERLAVALDVSAGAFFDDAAGASETDRRVVLLADIAMTLGRLDDADLEVAADQLAALAQSRSRRAR